MHRLDGSLPIAKELYSNYLQDNVKVRWNAFGFKVLFFETFQKYMLMIELLF